MNLTRRNFISVAASGLLATALVGCDSGSDDAKSDDAASEDAEPSQEAAPAEPAKYAVTIDGCEQATDYEGNPCVILTFTFTNNSDEAQAMMTAASIEVYQDGVQCDTAISSDVDTSGYTNKVKPGSSTEVKLVYSVEGTSDVEVEVYELFDLDKTALASQTFSLA